MNVSRKGYLGTMLAAVLVLGALLGACGTDSPSGKTVTTVSGVVTVGTPTVGLMTCTSCHPTETANWMQTKHGNVYPLGDLNSAGTPTLGQLAAGPCTECHDPQGDSGQLVAGYTGNTPRPVIGCESCHSGGGLHVAQGGAGPIGNTVYSAGLIGGATSSLQVSGQFMTCSFRCHELLDTNDPASTPAAAAHLVQAPTGSAYLIADTHFASGGTYSQGTGGRTLVSTPIGYSMDYASETVCTNCHDPHRTADIARDWANGPHGKTGRSSSTHFAWTDFNWSCQTNVPGCGTTEGAGDVPRPFCQRCHTTTGYKGYADALAAGDGDRVAGIFHGTISLLTYTPGWNPEQLQCTGCHTDVESGSLRNPGAYRGIYGYRVSQPYSSSSSSPTDLPAVIISYAEEPFQYPDLSSSNVCVPCHSGRNSGRTIKTMNTALSGTIATVDFSAIRVQNAHFMEAAAVIFRALGYEYDGRTYEDPPTYAHKNVGSAAAPGSGTGGPCVGCHMYQNGTPADHRFQNVNRMVTIVSGSTATTTVTTVSSPVCFTCHAGSATQLGAVVDQERAAYSEALLALSTQLAFKGLNAQNMLSRTPYYPFPISSEAVSRNNLGAAFNSASLSISRFTAAYVHNSIYAKRLIYDSIDWVDDNDMNHSVGTTLNIICSGPTPSTAWCGLGMPYILPNGIAPGSPAERP